MKSLNPIIAGWGAGAFVATVAFLLIVLVEGFGGASPSFEVSDILGLIGGFFFLLFYISLTMMFGIMFAGPIFYHYKSARKGYSWIIAGLAGGAIMSILMFLARIFDNFNDRWPLHWFLLLRPLCFGRRQYTWKKSAGRKTFYLRAPSVPHLPLLVLFLPYLQQARLVARVSPASGVSVTFPSTNVSGKRLDYMGIPASRLNSLTMGML
ncbi:MAG: hypothetical protein WCL08_01845 [Verrucomicrobiota bacterium]